MIKKSFKKTGITLNTDGSEDDLFIANNDEEVEEIIAEAGNSKKVDIKIVNEKVDEPIDDISSLVFAESDEEEEKKKKFIECVIMKKVDREESELIVALQEELNKSIFPKRLEERALHKFYGIKLKKRSSASEI